MTMTRATVPLPSAGSPLVRNAETETSVPPTNIPALPAEKKETRAIRIQIVNGCGVKGLAKTATTQLRTMGFDVREVSNSGETHYSRSRAVDRSGHLDWATMVADSLGISRDQVNFESEKKLSDIDVTVILGADYRSLRLNRSDTPRSER